MTNDLNHFTSPRRMHNHTVSLHSCCDLIILMPKHFLHKTIHVALVSHTRNILCNRSKYLGTTYSNTILGNGVTAIVELVQFLGSGMSKTKTTTRQQLKEKGPTMQILSFASPTSPPFHPLGVCHVPLKTEKKENGEDVRRSWAVCHGHECPCRYQH